MFEQKQDMVTDRISMKAFDEQTSGGSMTMMHMCIGAPYLQSVTVDTGCKWD